MLDFGILLKSYGQDFKLAKRLIESFNRFNPENLQMFIVVPDSDVQLFQVFESDTISVLTESLLGDYLVDHEVAGIRPGYINQEIVKLAFWELELTANYFCVDSDAVFIRPLSVDDFMFDESTPYTVLVEDNELKSEPRYFQEHWKGREPKLRRIQELVGLEDRRILTCHGHQVFSAKVLRSLKLVFMDPRDWSYEDLLRESPYEFSWYNMWLQKERLIPIEFREPLVKTIHHDGQLIETLIRGLALDDLAREYVGVVVNSNFDSIRNSFNISDSTGNVLAQYVSMGTLIHAAYLRFCQKVQGVLGSRR